VCIGGLRPAFLCFNRGFGFACLVPKKVTSVTVDVAVDTTNLIAADPVSKRILGLIAPTINAMGFEVVRLQYGGAPATLQVMIEPNNLGELAIEACARVSRAVSTVLDVADPISGEYTLEVSSPGVDRPLTRVADFDRFIGFDAKIELREAVEGQKRFRGKLAGFANGEVLLEIEIGTIGVTVDALSSAKLILTDALLAMAKRESTPDVRTGNPPA
jgi:ribosome maturation factor RimP